MAALEANPLILNNNASISTVANGGILLQTGTDSAPGEALFIGVDGSLGSADQPITTVFANAGQLAGVVPQNAASSALVNAQFVRAAIAAAGSGTSTPPTWTAATLVANYQNYSGGAWAQATAGFRKPDANHVELRGQLTGDGSAQTLFTLPSGFRPAYQVQFLVPGSAATCVIKINTDGTVKYAGGDGFPSLNGIVFPIN